MNLNFMKIFPDGSGTLSGKETHFKEKIFKSFNYPLYQEITEDFEIDTFIIMGIKPKKHTIRFLTNLQYNKWLKKDRVIHLRQWEDKPYRSNNNLIAPVVPVKSLQKITFNPMLMAISNNCFQLKDQRIFKISIDHYSLTKENIIKLAVNDGFDNAYDFFEYFTDERIKAAEKEGKHPYIIHWTDLKY